MTLLSSADQIGSTMWFECNNDDEPPPPYSEGSWFSYMAGNVARPQPSFIDKALPPLPISSLPQKRNRWSVRTQSTASGAAEPLISLSPVNLSISGGHSLSIAYFLETRSSKSVTLFRSDSHPASSRSPGTTGTQGSTQRAFPLYDISRSQQGQRFAVSLDSKSGDNFCSLSEPCSKLILHKIQTPDNNIAWELRYHRSYDFESIIGVRAAGSQAILICDRKAVWQTRNRKVVAIEGKASVYQNPPRRKAKQDGIKLPRIDISAGLDPKFVDLVVACWAAKAYFL